MPDQQPPDSFAFRDPRQARIYRRLLLVGPGPAAFFRDACRQMASAPIPTTTHLVGHLLRDTESALCSVLLPLTREDEAGEEKPNEGHRAKVRKCMGALHIPADDPVWSLWLRIATQNDAFNLPGWAHRDGLRAPRPIDASFREMWTAVQTVFDVVLDRLEAQFTEYEKVIDEILQHATPTSEDLKTLTQGLPNNPLTLGYFFDNLQSPAWLQPLREKGLFLHPQSPVVDDDEGTVTYPAWAASRWLARIAATPEAQRLVCDIVLEMPDTSNSRIHEDIADIAIALPPDLAVRLVERLKRAIEKSGWSRLPEKLGVLVARLATSGQLDATLDLGGSLFAILPDPRQEKDGGAELLLPEVRGHFNVWEYEQLLEKHLSALVTAGGERMLAFFGDRLSEAITLSQKKRDAETSDDYSWIWRPAIEDHGQNHRHGIRDLLTSAVRDAAVQLVRTSPDKLQSVVESLEARQQKTFHRIALHLLALFGAQAPALVSARLTDRGRFDDVAFTHEFAQLLKTGFMLLSNEQRAIFLGWIRNGPDVDRHRSYWKAQGRDLTEEDVQRFVKRWQRDRLTPIVDVLQPADRAWFDAMVAEVGPAEHPDFATYSTGTWIGPTSPKSRDELARLSVDELVLFLREWQPSDRSRDHTKDGLGRMLTEVIASDIGKYAPNAVAFKGLDPTYVRAFFDGLGEARRQKRTFSWDTVLTLATWVIQEAAENAGRAGGELDQDPHWGWTRKSIADLLLAGCVMDDGGIPFELRERTWAPIAKLAEDPNPSTEEDSRFGGTNGDPLTVALNSVRGQAIHAVIQYALWVHQHVSKTAKQGAPTGFGASPEAREVLEAHLRAEHDPSLAIRAVYGRLLPWLVILDEEWIRTHITALFPEAQSDSARYAALWETYICTAQYHTALGRTLMPIYERAIELLGADRSDRRTLADPDKQLAEHLMVMYWTGELSLTSRTLARFYEKAPGAIRAHAIEFIGRSLMHTEASVPSSILERIRLLWMARLDAARQSRAPDSLQEVEAFGWWFACGKFDDDWALDQLGAVGNLGVAADPDHLVVDRLAELAPRNVLAAIECLMRLVESSRNAWSVLGWTESMRTILQVALADSNEKAKQLARDLINRLAARGVSKFSDLL